MLVTGLPVGAQVEEIAFDASDGYDPFMTWLGVFMVAQRYPELAHLASFGANLRGNVEAGLKVTPLDVAKAERGRIAVFHRFRKLFDRFDVLLTLVAPVKPFPVEMNFRAAIHRLHPCDCTSMGSAHSPSIAAAKLEAAGDRSPHHACCTTPRDTIAADAEAIFRIA
jgi:hypothetical protein